MAGELEVELLVSGASPELPPRLDVQFRAEPGVTLLFGASGAGKSTCLAALAGLVRPNAGRVRLAERVLFDAALGVNLPVHERRVALVFQSLALFPHLTALANVSYGLPRALPREERRAQALGWLSRMRVAHLAERRPATISGGEAQRVALARALASRPELLLLDEPFSALDVPLRRELSAEVAGFIRELGIPALLVTHDLEDARALGERMLLLRAGKVDQSGSPAEVLANAHALPLGSTG